MSCHLYISCTALLAYHASHSEAFSARLASTLYVKAVIAAKTEPTSNQRPNKSSAALLSYCTNCIIAMIMIMVTTSYVLTIQAARGH